MSVYIVVCVGMWFNPSLPTGFWKHFVHLLMYCVLALLFPCSRWSPFYLLSLLTAWRSDGELHKPFCHLSIWPSKWKFSLCILRGKQRTATEWCIREMGLTEAARGHWSHQCIREVSSLSSRKPSAVVKTQTQTCPPLPLVVTVV